MELIQAKIAEVKNLDLIYAYSIDSIFGNDNNKYVGLRIVFDKNKTLSLDYRNKYFSDFVKKVIDRYKKEQDKRKIVLLGDLAKRLVNDSSFDIEDNTKLDGVQEEGIPYFKCDANNVKQNLNFLKEAMKIIILAYKKYETLQIDSIEGYGHRYFVDYSIGNIHKKMPIVIYEDEEGKIFFKVARIGNLDVDIKGKVESDGGRVDVSWQNAYEDIQGSIHYDALERSVERQMNSLLVPIYYDDNEDTLLEEDAEIIKFYFDMCMCGQKVPSHILKTSDNSFLLAEEEVSKEDDDQVLFTNIGAKMITNPDEVRIKYRLKNGFSKYNNQINVTLDEDTLEVTLKKMTIDDDNYLLMERVRTNNSGKAYSYYVYEVDGEVDLTKPFNYQRSYKVDEKATTLEKVKQYVYKHKGGKE